MSSEGPATFAFVTGHEYGEAMFRAILGLPEYGTMLRCSLLLCLDQSKSSATVGYNDLGPFAKQHGVRVEYIRSIKTDHALALLRGAAPDYLMVIGWSELAPPEILDLPKSKHRGALRHAAAYAAVGLHTSLLPEGRGRAPLPWAIIKGLKRTGATAFLLEPDADTGAIVEQIEIPMDADETATTLFAKVRASCIELGVRLGRSMAARAVTWTAQDERLASVWPRRRPEDGRIDFSAPAADIDRLVRALTPPFPGAFFQMGDVAVRVHKVEMLPLAERAVPGTILAAGPAPVVAVGDAAIRLVDIEPAGAPFVPGTILRGRASP